MIALRAEDQKAYAYGLRKVTSERLSLLSRLPLMQLYCQGIQSAQPWLIFVGILYDCTFYARVCLLRGLANK